MAQKSYAYACARVSALSKRLLDDTALKRMAEGSMGDALRILIDDRYGNLPDAGEGDGERMIERELIAMREEVRSISPEPAITDLFLLQSDVMRGRPAGGRLPQDHQLDRRIFPPHEGHAPGGHAGPGAGRDRRRKAPQ